MTGENGTEHVDRRLVDLMRRSSGAGPDAARGARAVRPAADWQAGLDERSMNAQEISLLLQRAYEDRGHGRTPAALVRQIEDLAHKVTGEPRRDPEHGPGMWTDMTVHPIDAMAAARPLDLNGSPTGLEIDLMMVHTIRMGERLCRTYPDWSQTLPSCWIRHAYIVEEVFALACYQDLAVSSQGAGFYAPALQQNIQSALGRIKEQMSVEGAAKNNHVHDMADPDSRERAARRMREYRAWAAADRSEEWTEQAPLDFGDQITDLPWPARPPELQPVDDRTLRQQADTWAQEIEGRRQSIEELEQARASYEATHPGQDAEPTFGPQADALRADMDRWADRMERSYAAWAREERDARDDLDKARAEARKRLADRRDPLSPRHATALTRLKELADRILAEHDDGRDEPRPHPIGAQRALAAEIRRASGLREQGDPLARAQTLVDRVHAILDTPVPDTDTEAGMDGEARP